MSDEPYIKRFSIFCQPVSISISGIQSILHIPVSLSGHTASDLYKKTGCYMESCKNHLLQPALHKCIVNQYFIWLTTFLRGIYNEIFEILSAVIPTFSQVSSLSFFRYVSPWPQSTGICRFLSAVCATVLLPCRKYLPVWSLSPLSDKRYSR